MKQSYDSEADALNIQLTDGIYWKSVELSNGVVIDISKDGKILAIEILHASKALASDFKRVVGEVTLV